MLRLLLSSLALASSTFAAPLVAPSTFPTLVHRQDSSSSSFNITYRSPESPEYASLSRLLIVATGECSFSLRTGESWGQVRLADPPTRLLIGGTIAGVSESETDSTAYTVSLPICRLRLPNEIDISSFSRSAWSRQNLDTYRRCTGAT